MEPTASDTSSSPAQDTRGRWWILNWWKRPTKSEKKDEVKATDTNDPKALEPEVEQVVAPRGGKKLSADQAMKLVYWIATFKKNAEIHELLKENFGFDIKDSLIAHYRYSEDYRSFIQKIRDRWGNDLLHVELATKRRRLEEIENIFEKCVSKEQYKNALMALSQIQHEVEKDVQNLSLTQYNVNVYKDMTDAELEEERLKTMERIKQLKGALPCPVVKNENPESKE